VPLLPQCHCLDPLVNSFDTCTCLSVVNNDQPNNNFPDVQFGCGRPGYAVRTGCGMIEHVCGW